MDVVWFARKTAEEGTGYKVVHWKGWAAIAGAALPGSVGCAIALASSSTVDALPYVGLMLLSVAVGGLVIWLHS